jgi:hypothetical protein
VKPQGLSKQYRAIMKNRVERDQVRHGVQTYQEDAHDTGMVQLTVRHTLTMAILIRAVLIRARPSST